MIINGSYPIEAENKYDDKYHGVVTDVRKLPVGTRFYVCNGNWFGAICKDDISKYIRFDNNEIHRFYKNKPLLLCINPRYTKMINLDLKDYPCNVCKNICTTDKCNKYHNWLYIMEKQRSYNLDASEIEKFLIPKDVIYEYDSNSKYNNLVNLRHGNFKFYKCPNCKTTIRRDLIKRNNKPKFCMKCGQLLKFDIIDHM